MWAHVMLVWAIAAYLLPDPLDEESFRTRRRWLTFVFVRATLATAVTAALSANLPLVTLVLVASVTLPIARSRISARHSAELEIGTNVIVAGTSLLFVTRNSLELERVILAVPVSNDRISVICIVIALLFFTIHGGTYVVRGVLNKSGAVPMVGVEGEKKIDVKEFNRGRLIGVLERILLFAVVIAGSYEALGFIIAAKGLIRSREFEQNRDMTEYFLIGSLASVLVALTTGSIARHLLALYK
ncbi:MAG TPA: hypothetical protein VFP80_15495 [Thermoanaerobaculia bacterium]|nr:hypothetical protein [Thermoanaerobaculia bacterium]